jgi:predicted transcriptional regulator
MGKVKVTIKGKGKGKKSGASEMHHSLEQSSKKGEKKAEFILMPDRSPKSNEEEIELTLDDILTVLENSTRRKILEKLTKETHYPLQLSKELNVSQQAIMKHLKVLEAYGLVECFEEKSTTGGPPRKCYTPTKNLSLRIDIGPNTFEAKMRRFDQDQSPMLMGEGEDVQEIPNEYVEIMKSKEDPHEKLSRLTKLIEKVDAKIADIEDQRTYLTQMRGSLLREVYKIIAQLAPDYNERKVLYYIARSHNTSIPAISEALDMREKVLRDLFRALRKDRLFWWDEEDLF